MEASARKLARHAKLLALDPGRSSSVRLTGSGVVPEKTIYIAGYGRSGSTVLGTLLGAHPDAVHVGESAFLFDELTLENRSCSCGRPYPECPFWRDLLPVRKVWTDAARVTRRAEGLRGLAKHLLHSMDPGTRAGYAVLHANLLASIRARAHAGVIVDSSKSAWATVGRFLALNQDAGEDVYAIHLVRSGRATLNSLLRTGSNWELEGRHGRRRARALRAVVGWTAVNRLVGRLASRLPAGRYLQVRYDDLIDDPAGTLERIGEFVGLDLGEVVSAVRAGESIPVGHLVGGNRLRFKGVVRLAPARAPVMDPPLGLGARLLFRVVGRSLERRYGYI